MALSDLQRLVENMQRAKSIMDRVANDAAKHSAIMDNFEKRLDINHENITKIEEYEKLLAQMDNLGNGGPPLDASFPASTEVATATTSPSSSPRDPYWDQTSGKQL